MYEAFRNIYRSLKKIPFVGGLLAEVRNVLSPYIETRRIRSNDRKEAHRFVETMLGGDMGFHQDIDRFATSSLFHASFGHGHSGDYDVLVLYAIIKALKPEHVIETGVASGRSSAAILQAMKENGKGMLHSIDLAEFYEGEEPEYYQNQYGIAELKGYVPAGKKVGWAVPDELQGRWNLVIGDSNIELPKLLERVGVIDVFYHDSDHSYETMSNEFKLAWPKLRDGGFLIADDVSWNDAWKEFTFAHADLPKTLYRKFGVMKKGT